jgi:hypothetical protein
MIEKISNLPSWRIGDFVFTFEQLERLYYAIGSELLDVAVENGDFDTDPPDQYNISVEGKDH